MTKARIPFLTKVASSIWMFVICSLPAFAGTESLSTGNPAEPVLIVREYKMPANFLELMGKRSEVPWLMSNTGPFPSGASALFIKARSVLVVRSTKAQQRIAAAKVRDVWKKSREAAAKMKP